MSTHSCSKKPFFFFLPPAHIYLIVPILVASFFCLCSFSRCHGFHSACTDISDRIKNKAGRKASGGPSLLGGRSALSPAGPLGSDSVMDYRTVIGSSTSLMRSHCHKGIKKKKNNPKRQICPISITARGAESDGASASLPLGQVVMQNITRPQLMPR